MSARRCLTLLVVICSITLGCVSTDIHATGGINQKPNKIVRELTVQGEHPEIVACLVAALKAIKNHHDFSELLISKSIADTAITQEAGTEYHHTRMVMFVALAEDRKDSVISLSSWQTIRVTCVQDDEEQPAINLHALKK